MEVGSKPLEEEPEMEPMTKGATGLNVMLCLLALHVSQEEMLLQKMFLIIGMGRQPAQKR